jgi:hypothetical protein
MRKEYESAMKASFLNGTDWRIPFIDSTKTMAVRTHGAQTLGLTSLPMDNKFDRQILIGDYFMPSFFSGVATPDDNGLLFRGNAVRAVNHGTNSTRIFPMENIPGDLPRCQTINPGPENTLIVTRNADNRIFTLIPPEDPSAPTTEPESKWDIWGRATIHSTNANTPMMVHSLLPEGHRIITIESSFVLRDDWILCEYEIVNFVIGPRRCKIVIAKKKSTKIPDFTYGITRAKDGGLLFITDYRSPSEEYIGLKERGVYKGPGVITDNYANEMKLVRPEVWGNGLGLIGDGVLISVYGMSEPGPFNGEPGRLVYLPKL